MEINNAWLMEQNGTLVLNGHGVLQQQGAQFLETPAIPVKQIRSRGFVGVLKLVTLERKVVVEQNRG